MARQKPIEAAFERFSETVIPEGATQSQQDGMRVSFYAGVTTLFGILMESADDGKDEPTPENLDLMDSIAAELAAFGDEQRQTH